MDKQDQDRRSRPTQVDQLPAQASIIDLAETLVAMANNQGGTLILQLGGITSDDAIDRVREASLRSVPPLILPVPIVSDGTSITVDIPRGLPHVYSLDGRFLWRDNGINYPLAPHDLRRLMIERGDVNYEEEISRNASIDDLDWRKVETYAARLTSLSRESAHEVLLRRGCLVKREGRWLPTNAGILLFGKDPQRFTRAARITAVRFGGEEMGDVFTRQDIGGTLPDQIYRAETFLLDNLRKGVHLGANMVRSEQLEYPMEAARELVVNAVAHRDYSIQGDDIRLFIFSDRLEVTSPGGLPGPVTLANIVEERYSRNSIIVQVLSDLGFIERLGYGIDRVIALMQTYDLPAPHFAETSGGFRANLFNAFHAAIPRMADSIPEPYQSFSLNPRQESAIQFLTQNNHSRITNKDLQELYPDVHPETIRRDLVDLVSKGILIKFGEKRGSYYILQKSS